MSFSVELWDGYDLVYNTFCLHRRGLRDFIYMLNEKHKYEAEFAKGMKCIYDMNYLVTTMPSLQNGVIAFKNDLLNQYNYTIDFVMSLREEVIDPLKSLMTDQNNFAKTSNSEMKKIEKEFKDSAERMDKARIKFHSLAKLAEDNKLLSEMAKLNLNLNSMHKMKLELNAQNSLKEAKESERVYITSVAIANNNRDIYIETMKRMLNEFQTMEEKLIEAIRDALRKYVIYQVALIRNMQYDVEKKASQMESVNIQADIRSFVESNATNSLPPRKFDFIPYITDIDSKSYPESNKYPKEVLTNIKNFISNVFYTEPPESEPDSIESKNLNELETIVNLAWEGKKLPEEGKRIFLKFIKDKKYRRYFLSCINKYRMSGLFTLDEKSYFIIGDLISCCLDEVVKDRDYHSAKDCMNLAQTLYKTASEPNKPRVFLQSLVQNHILWKSLEFWEEFIKYIINEEMHSQKNYNIYTFESAKEKLRRGKTIVVTQLISFSYNMLSYDINKKRVEDVILYFSKYYEIEEENIGNIIKNLEEYSFLNKKKEKDDVMVTPEKSSGNSLSVDEIINSELEGVKIPINNLNFGNNNNLSLTSTDFKVSNHIDDVESCSDETYIENNKTK